MIHPQTLLQSLQRALPPIEQDIAQYLESQPELIAHLEAEYQKVVEAGRTAEHPVAWRDAQITQAAVAWVITCVFVRFLEDNQLLDEPLLAGPVERDDGSRPLQLARERLTAYFNEHPTHGEREYLLSLFEDLARQPVLDALLDRRHNPLWQLPVSADGARYLVDFFQRIDPETGQLIHDFTDPDWDTRFLGDLYQDLSESVRKRYALLQTPEFVEAFILDYTLERALEDFSLKDLRLIDPTCGSGHFLLTAFERLFDAWQRREAHTNTRHLAQRALDAVHGVDINPYAIAIARFRLLIAAMKASGTARLHQAPDFHFNLAVGDSLLHGRRHEKIGGGIQQDMLDQDDALRHVLESEDLALLERILGQTYHVVVGNPPYITVKDKALNEAYRGRYATCHRQYSLGVPFTERFFDLTLPAQGNQSAGYLGMITANSFMKREFGKKLIENYLPRKDLTHVIDTSGAYIPGHGTPTVILFARHQAPSAPTLRAVLGIRGEPKTPEDAAQGRVWRSIVELLERPGSENEFVSVVDQARASYGTHPWSVGGGGATELKEYLEQEAETSLGDVAESPIGRAVRIAGEEIFMFSAVRKRQSMIDEKEFRGFLIGEQVRDWSNVHDTWVWYPYTERSSQSRMLDHLWTWRKTLAGRKTFQGVMADAGLRWFDYMQHTASAYKTPLSLTFAFVATHNHFVLDRGGMVFKQSAPVIKLPEGATEDEHLTLLGLLNSSVGMFWMRQVFHGKGQGGIGQESRAEWEEFREFTGTGLKKFPIAIISAEEVLVMSRELDHLAQQQSTVGPEQVLSRHETDVKAALTDAQSQDEHLWHQMIALQEELDWHCYRLYGLMDEDLRYAGTPPPVRLGERPFEIHLARRMAAGEVQSTWFQRHGSTPITEIPDHWPADYRDQVARRLEAIEHHRWITLVEQPEYKRRWNREPWDKRQERATRQWLLDRLETQLRTQEAALITCAQLADQMRTDDAFTAVATLHTGHDLFDLQALVSDLVAGDQVPQMAAARLKPAAMKIFRAWQDTWDKQRQEDAIDARHGVAEPLSPEAEQDAQQRAAHAAARQRAEADKAREIGPIPVPPKYKSTDFRQSSYWTLRGKLDVPKERFFSLPGCEKPGDATLVIGWAGLDHLQRAQAIAHWYVDRKETDGWDAPRLLPMLVALEELIPWLKQWHNDLHPEYGERMGDFYEQFLLEELRALELTREDLHHWQPAATRRGRQGRRG
ncbi:BREX-2 system adenine-specific DNA-methyltransferase PglX [Ectothiorhodospira shaposhnikovii]|uniref:BREX-2 system adenine-specific DNA-methyltransferase PglX n=1 Tax=Ectothiorhodospira shaposhnikovii TaxID=1054 RepID=UPI001EE7C9CC|nr:BREX-2 system adenine-specific DNA-methyltransferase PglX [Ectothiorhodospira shaposhnikovii]MCG5514076.1 BREX-2 system adenine-specific DNA-methyltransferase PglX [Ectothiorhodospira shaposhnikovii]